MKRILITMILLWISHTSFTQSSIGVFQNAADVGKPKVTGASQYHKDTKSYTLKGGGYNIWFNRDEFHYLYNKIKGDFTLTANFEFIGKGTDPHRKIGWMIRPSLDEKDVHASAVLHGDGLTVLQWRTAPGAAMRDPEDEIFYPGKNPQVLQLQRRGNVIIMRVAAAKGQLQEVGRYEMKSLPEEVLAGLFICSHNPEVQESSKVWNVLIEK